MALAAPISALAMRPGCKELYFVTAPCNSTSKAATEQERGQRCFTALPAELWRETTGAIAGAMMPEAGARAADVSAELEGPACVMGDLSIMSNMQLNWVCSIQQKFTCHSMHDCIRLPTHDANLAARSTMML